MSKKFLHYIKPENQDWTKAFNCEMILIMEREDNNREMPQQLDLSDQQFLIKLAKTEMPFGKYKGRLLSNLPEAYVLWFQQKGFPKGELGEMLKAMVEIKANGLEYLLREIAARYS